MLEELKQKVYKANMMLKEKELIILTWGNASGIHMKG
jgi:ribulose-5-phosphate 4-epimerase/fuculose-1-phosphate aldolase